MDERRKDYIDLVEILKGGVENTTNIKSMKKTLEKHGKDIEQIKDSQFEISTNIKGLNINFDECLKIFSSHKKDNDATDKLIRDTDDRVKSLEVKLKWILAGMLAFFSFLGTIVVLFGKKIATTLAILLP